MTDKVYASAKMYKVIPAASTAVTFDGIKNGATAGSFTLTRHDGTTVAVPVAAYENLPFAGITVDPGAIADAVWYRL